MLGQFVSSGTLIDGIKLIVLPLRPLLTGLRWRSGNVAIGVGILSTRYLLQLQRNTIYD